ncbi:SDR family oxidoreductase [Cyclobacterium amurskyense]|uniref:NAD-dependent epimerase/dehydratase n=1 Tax=Cyclobacterium amurskyense TaxID=320787 RepID=A0A0H4PUQ1_9BACT|nr:SDR family oxidoreductase [Cyclobacterium amurskyense]AKP52062.1 NAD-dependent epimerase/dehydratase [Cyclobacterium amurskyense]|tara:strand:+ start:40560 stop:41225 length:666 start_codon:yes stop_codon:yes gene_type:complete
MEKVLIIGANGNVGRILIENLSEHPDYSPVAMVRKESQAEELKNKGVSTVIADLEENFGHAFQGMDKVIFAAGSGAKTGKDKTDLVDKKGAIRSVDFSIKYGVRKFIMLSSRGAENAEKADETMQHYLLAKKAADEYLKSTNLPYAIVRPGALTNGPATGKIKIANIFNEKGDISRKDVAAVLIHMLDHGIDGTQVFEILSGKVEIEDAVRLYLKTGQEVT